MSVRRDASEAMVRRSCCCEYMYVLEESAPNPPMPGMRDAEASLRCMDRIGIELEMPFPLPFGNIRVSKDESILTPDLNAFGEVNIYFGFRVGGAPMVRHAPCMLHAAALDSVGGGSGTPIGDWSRVKTDWAIATSRSYQPFSAALSLDNRVSGAAAGVCIVR